MADESARPLLDRGSRSPSPRRPSSATRSVSPHSGQQARPFELSLESTPLLVRRDDGLDTYGTQSREYSPSESPSSSWERNPKKPRRRIGPIFLAIILLLTAVIILTFSFAAPTVMKEYANEATVFHPTNLSIDSATSDGVRTRVQGDIVLDANRVEKKSVKDLGRFFTWLAREIETDKSEVQVYLPEYGDALVGTASLPSFKVNIRNGHVNHVDFHAKLTAGDVQGVRTVAIDWLEGRLDRLRVEGQTTVKLKSGLLNLGTQDLSDTIVFESGDFPALPKVNITKANVYDADPPSEKGAMAVDLSLRAMIDSPFALRVPRLGFQVLVPNCSPGDPYISVADANTEVIQIDPGHTTSMEVDGLIRGLSSELTAVCPGKKHSPLDFLVKSYTHGRKTTIYVRGVEAPSLGTPAWIGDLLKNVTVPLPFTGHSLDNLVKNFTMSKTHFSLPNPLAEPGSPEAQLRVSSLVNALVSVPKQMNFWVDVPQVRATAGVYYNGTKLGNLVVPKWQEANSTLIENRDGSPALSVQFPMRDAPLDVTNEDALTEILQSLIFERKSVNLTVAVAVDAKVSTGLGKFAVRGIPADGKVHVKPPYSGGLGQIGPRLESVELGPTTESSLLMKTTMNFTNPTKYSATVPLLDLMLLYNATKIAHMTARDVSVIPGNNSGIQVDLLWDPLASGGADGIKAGREMVSQYVSGYNTTATVQTYNGSIPALPILGETMSKLSIEIPLPKVSGPRLPGDGDGEPRDDGLPHFIQDATLHLFSSTAEFILSSPLSNTTILVTSIDATAFYEETEVLGTIDYQRPFEIPPGLSQTPRLPVNLNMGGIGYSALKRALGDSLEIGAIANVGVSVENYRDSILYKGDGISANIRI